MKRLAVDESNAATQRAQAPPSAQIISAIAFDSPEIVQTEATAATPRNRPMIQKYPWDYPEPSGDECEF